MIVSMGKSFFKVLFVELSTGIVLDKKKEYQHGKFDDSYSYFKTYDEALAFSKEITSKSPEIECLILNEENQFIHIERNQKGYTKNKEK